MINLMVRQMKDNLYRVTLEQNTDLITLGEGHTKSAALAKAKDKLGQLEASILPQFGYRGDED